MVFGLFKRKDPICGMKEEKEKGISKYGRWFCSQNCINEYEKTIEKSEKTSKSCCH